MNMIDSEEKNTNPNQIELNANYKHESQKYAIKTGRIYLAAITVNLSAVAIGTCMTWTSPILPKLRSEDTHDSPLSRPITVNEEAWIGSIIAIGAMMTPILAGPLADKIGRKKVLLSSSIFFIIGFVFMLIAKEIWILLIGRFIKGVGAGFVMCVSPIYVGEISDDRTRGSAGSFMSLLMILGLLYVLCIGPFVSYMTLQYCCLLIPIVFAMTFIFMPESPFFYIAKDQRSNASKALQFLRGQSALQVEAELLTIENVYKNTQTKKSDISEIFKTRGNRKALLISFGLIFFQQLSGVGPVLFYTQTIFEGAHISLEAAIASIIVVAMEAFSAAIAPFVINHFGRKIILMYSAIFMCIGLTALGYFFFSQNVLESTKGITWLPVPALVAYIFALAIGFGPLPWAILGEIFPPNIKSLAAAMTTTFCWLIAFMVTLFFPYLSSLGSYYAFWLFAIFCILAYFFVLFVVIETKNLSFDEIQNKLDG